MNSRGEGRCEARKEPAATASRGACRGVVRRRLPGLGHRQRLLPGACCHSYQMWQSRARPLGAGRCLFNVKVPPLEAAETNVVGGVNQFRGDLPAYRAGQLTLQKLEVVAGVEAGDFGRVGMSIGPDRQLLALSESGGVLPGCCVHLPAAVGPSSVPDQMAASAGFNLRNGFHEGVGDHSRACALRRHSPSDRDCEQQKTTACPAGAERLK